LKIESAQGHIFSVMWYMTAIDIESTLRKVCTKVTHDTYVTPAVRQSRKAEIDAWVTEVLIEKSSAHWLELLTKARIPCGPVNRFDQALQGSQILARKMVVPVQLNTGETVNMPGNPVKLEHAIQSYSAPPTLGQHTDDILIQLMHYDAQTVAQLKAAGIVA
jgi:crotonobetainyl-CoA:carnitine CoA-transferase CaiB-like acyl-CoA transferase